jgi:hypothetical protein
MLTPLDQKREPSRRRCHRSSSLTPTMRVASASHVEPARPVFRDEQDPGRHAQHLARVPPGDEAGARVPARDAQVGIVEKDAVFARVLGHVPRERGGLLRSHVSRPSACVVDL